MKRKWLILCNVLHRQLLIDQTLFNRISRITALRQCGKYCITLPEWQTTAASITLTNRSVGKVINNHIDGLLRRRNYAKTMSSMPPIPYGYYTVLGACWYRHTSLSIELSREKRPLLLFIQVFLCIYTFKTGTS